MNAHNFLDLHLVNGTCNQIDDVSVYLDAVVLHSTYVGETEKNGNEVLTFQDGSVLVRIDDEAFAYNDLTEYRG